MGYRLTFVPISWSPGGGGCAVLTFLITNPGLHLFPLYIRVLPTLLVVQYARPQLEITSLAR